MSLLAGSEVTLREVVPASLMARTRQPQPRVITGQGPAWIEQAEAAPHLRATDAALDLCVPVELEVARLTLTDSASRISVVNSNTEGKVEKLRMRST